MQPHLGSRTATDKHLGAFAFVYAFALTTYGSATPFHPAEFGVTSLLSMVPYATFAAGLAFGAAFATPFELAYGRKPVFLYSTPLFAILMIGAGVSKNIAGLAACRFLAAFFASPTLFLSYAIISDMWVLIHETLAIAGFVSSFVLGIFVGYVVELSSHAVLSLTKSGPSLAA